MSEQYTPNQKRLALDVQKAVAERRIVYLSGRNNGKTRILNAVQEKVFDMEKANITMRARKDDGTDYSVIYVDKIHFTQQQAITESSLMRQILGHLGFKAGRETYKVEIMFHNFLLELKKRKQVLCLVLDNAELLSKRAYSILKYFHEYRDHKTNSFIGPSLLLAGEYQYLKMPMAFRKKTFEIRVDRFNNEEEILTMIDSNWPGMRVHFQASKHAMQLLKEHETMLEIAAAAEAAIREMKRLRLNEITADMIEASEIFRKAA